eukprot:1158743-Pelagomonas_calceolata.AAC.32
MAQSVLHGRVIHVNIHAGRVIHVNIRAGARASPVLQACEYCGVTAAPRHPSLQNPSVHIHNRCTYTNGCANARKHKWLRMSTQAEEILECSESPDAYT